MVDPVSGAISRLGDAVTEEMKTVVTDLAGNMLDINGMVTDFNGTLKMGLSQGKGFKEAMKMAADYTGGDLQTRLDNALGSYTFTNKDGMSVTIGSGLDQSVLTSMAQAYQDAGFAQTSGKTIIYNAAPNNSLTAEQELVKAVKVARLV
jgi:hypothetical protein